MGCAVWIPYRIGKFPTIFNNRPFVRPNAIDTESEKFHRAYVGKEFPMWGRKGTLHHTNNNAAHD